MSLFRLPAVARPAPPPAATARIAAASPSRWSCHCCQSARAVASSKRRAAAGGETAERAARVIDPSAPAARIERSSSRDEHRGRAPPRSAWARSRGASKRSPRSATKSSPRRRCACRSDTPRTPHRGPPRSLRSAPPASPARWPGALNIPAPPLRAQRRCATAASQNGRRRRRSPGRARVPFPRSERCPARRPPMPCAIAAARSSSRGHWRAPAGRCLLDDCPRIFAARVVARDARRSRAAWRPRPSAAVFRDRGRRRSQRRRSGDPAARRGGGPRAAQHLLESVGRVRIVDHHERCGGPAATGSSRPGGRERGQPASAWLRRGGRCPAPGAPGERGGGVPGVVTAEQRQAQLGQRGHRLRARRAGRSGRPRPARAGVGSPPPGAVAHRGRSPPAARRRRHPAPTAWAGSSTSAITPAAGRPPCPPPGRGPLRPSNSMSLASRSRTPSCRGSRGGRASGS